MSELDQYDYQLPNELIAQQPLACREDARLMVVRRATETIEHWQIRDLPNLLEPRDILVLNDTKVVPARLVGYRTRTRGRWQGLFLSVDNAGTWKIICKTRGRLLPGETITLTDLEGQDAARLLLVTKLPEGVWAARPEVAGDSFALLDRVGRVPIPPYIRGGEMQSTDRDRYQTVFARSPGAIAAPTAGLHFTPALLNRIVDRGVNIARVTLHVGIGTFRTVAVERLADHVMHYEYGCIDEAAVRQISERRAIGGRVVAVGTTVTRTLETAAAGGKLQPWSGETNLFIRPPYEFRAIDALLTNFHLPKSTLLILVRTLGGDALLRRAYEEAIRHRYRFFSYGDAMLIV